MKGWVCMNERHLIEKISKVCGYDGELNITGFESDRLIVDAKGTDVSIGYSDITDFCRGISLAIMHIRKGENEFRVEQKRRVKTSGIMLDSSYEGMLTVDSLKTYIDYMASMGLNMLMLYTEDTYEVPKYPQMGYQRGRYTASEFKELDSYAKSMGVELIGCIQTLGHMEQVVKWASFSDIAENHALLLPGEERTYEFIEECIKTISENISSRRIHVGLDETFGLCEGKYRELHGESDPLEVYTDHIIRVYEICKKYGLSPMMWSDCFFRFSMKNPGYGIQYSATEPINPRILEKVPNDMEMVYWEYEEQNQANYDAIIKAHKPLGGNCIMATAAWTWDGQLPYIDYTFKTQVPALSAAVENNLDTVLATVWVSGSRAGDYFWTLPTVALYGQFSYDNTDTSRSGVAELLKNCTDMDMDALSLCDCYHSPEKFMFYFGEKYVDCPVLINTVGSTQNPADEYREASEKMKKFKSDKWDVLYSYASDLLELVSIKCEILNKLQSAYAKNDNEYMTKCAKELVPRALSLLYSLRERRQERWLDVQKPFGFGKINAHFGAAIANMEYAKARLDSYVDGKVDRLEELETPNMGYKYADDKKCEFRYI